MVHCVLLWCGVVMCGMGDVGWSGVAGRGGMVWCRRMGYDVA